MRIFLQLCDACKVYANDLHQTTGQESYGKMCWECQGKIMQSVRILISDVQAPAAVCVKLPKIPDEKELSGFGRRQLLELLEQLR